MDHFHSFQRLIYVLVTTIFLAFIIENLFNQKLSDNLTISYLNVIEMCYFGTCILDLLCQPLIVIQIGCKHERANILQLSKYRLDYPHPPPPKKKHQDAI